MYYIILIDLCQEVIIEKTPIDCHYIYRQIKTFSKKNPLFSYILLINFANITKKVSKSGG